MNEYEQMATISPGTTVTFVPAAAESAGSARRKARLTHETLIHRIIEDLRQPMKSLARRIRRFGPRDGGTVLLASGCAPGTGCTTTALALGAAAAEESAVVVIDGDTLTRGLSLMLSPGCETGWDDVLRGTARVHHAVHELPSWPGLGIVPLAAPPGTINELVAAPRFARMLAELRREFDLIILDGGPVRDHGERWAPWVDVALLVCHAGRQVMADGAAAWDLLEEKGTHVLGLVETDA
jgi:Mrp family chromosome partitioning ATPase